jgi:hypothetical protein
MNWDVCAASYTQLMFYRSASKTSGFAELYFWGGTR